MNIQQAKIKDIFPYTRNAKKHDKVQISNVAESIKQFGMVQPIVVDKDNNVIIGHCRLLACKQLKMKEVPIVKLEDLTPEEANKLRLLDNKLNESEWDFNLLAEDVPSLDFDGFDIDWGIPEGETTEEKEIVEDDVPEVPEEPVSKLGDLWRLGSHRLICGDSTDSNVIDRLMDGVKADMVFTDPPYNIDFKGSMSNTTKNGVMIKHKGANQRHGSIKNDKMTKGEFYNFICKSLDIIKENVKGAWYISFSSANIEELLNPLRDKKWIGKALLYG